MIGAGTFINPLLKVVTVVAILAAVYYFAIRPVLDTTEDITNRTFDAVNPALESSQEQIKEALRQAEQSTPGSQSFSYQVSGPPKQVKRVLDCIQRAGNDVARLQACTTK